MDAELMPDHTSRVERHRRNQLPHVARLEVARFGQEPRPIRCEPQHSGHHPRAGRLTQHLHRQPHAGDANAQGACVYAWGVDTSQLGWIEWDGTGEPAGGAGRKPV